jgi:DHA1 family multidrug resistance protein-like MFS transporter
VTQQSGEALERGRRVGGQPAGHRQGRRRAVAGALAQAPVELPGDLAQRGGTDALQPGLVLPVLPLFARSFGVGYGAVGVLVSAYGLARLVFDLAAGRIVDRLGERVTAAIGLAVISLGSALTGMAPAFAMAVIAWAAAGVGSAIALAALYTRLLRIVPTQQMARTLGIFYGAFNTGFIAGGALSGLVADRSGLAGPLLLNAAVVAVAAVLWLALIPGAGRPGRAAGPTPAPAGAEPPDAGGARSLARLLRTPGLVPVVVTNFAYLWMVAVVFDTLVPLFASDVLGLSAIGIGVLIAVALAAEFVVLYPAGSVADQRGRKPVLVPALAGLAVATAALGQASTPLLLGVLLAVLGVMSGAAGVPPGAMLSDVAPASASGTAVGVFRFCGDLGFTLGPLLAGWATPVVGFRWAFALAAVPTAVAMGFILRTPETLRPAEAG